MQQDASIRAGEWHEIWKVGVGDDLAWPCDVEIALTGGFLQDVNEFVDCTKTYKNNSALGVDWLHPRHYGMLSSGTIRALLAIIRTMVYIGCTPNQIYLLLIALIPKIFIEFPFKSSKYIQF